MGHGEKDRKGRSVPWSPNRGAVSDRHPFKRALMRNPLWKYISKHVSLPFIITEFFFGAWMSCVAINLIGGFADPANPDIVLYAISAAYMVNIIWGIIDGWSYNMCITMAASEDDRALLRLMNDRDDEEARAHLMASLDSGPANHLSYEDKEKLLESILASGPDTHPKKVYKFKKGNINAIGAFLLIDVLVATLTILPFLILSDLTAAMISSRMVTVSVFACVAYVSAKYLNRNWLLWVAVMSALGIFVAQATFLYS